MIKLDRIRLLHAGVTPRTDWIFLEATSAEGSVGWGEATLQDQESDVARAAPSILNGISGAEVSWHGLFDQLTPRTLPEAAVVSALCQAVSDLEAQARSAPVASLLGAGNERRVGLYANINRRNADRLPKTMAESAALAIGAGYTAVKIAPFDEVTPDQAMADMAKGLERIAAVRERIGADTRLMIDCHWRFTPGTAAAMINACAAFDPWWIECPVDESGANIEAIRNLRSKANAHGIRLAGLETQIGRAGFAPWIRAEAYDVMMPDVKYAGGPEEMLRLADDMAKAGIAFSPHNPSGPICHAHSIHICAAVGDSDLLEHQFDETPLFDSLVGGALVPPGTPAAPRPLGPGIGIGVDLSVMPMKTLYANSMSAPEVT